MLPRPECPLSRPVLTLVRLTGAAASDPRETSALRTTRAAVQSRADIAGTRRYRLGRRRPGGSIGSGASNNDDWCCRRIGRSLRGPPSRPGPRTLNMPTFSPGAILCSGTISAAPTPPLAISTRECCSIAAVYGQRSEGQRSQVGVCSGALPQRRRGRLVRKPRRQPAKRIRHAVELSERTVIFGGAAGSRVLQ
jgi:hypothetical protein